MRCPESDDPSIIVLDEPTAALPARDVEQLFGTIRHLTQAGNAVVLVSHHLDEILGISDTITVLRDGVRVATVGVKEVNHDSLVQLIIGKALVKGSGREEAIDPQRIADAHAPRPVGGLGARGQRRCCTPVRSSASPASPARGANCSPA